MDFKKGGGLVPAIVKDARKEKVSMLGYMTAASLAVTQETGLVTFYSRSRETLWTKGESSGNTLSAESITVDCDNDTLLVRAVPAGPTCHLGTTSCFGDKGPEGLGFLAYLEDLIEGRKTADADSSYTASLLQGPLRRAAQNALHRF